MLPSYHHGGSMPGMGSKPLRRSWFQDINGTLIAILVLAVVLALEHFHFQSRLSRVSSLEISLATQLKDVELSIQQQTEQLQKMNPRLDEIDSAELSLKRLQEEVSKAISGLAEVKAVVAAIQSANTTAQLAQAIRQQGQNLTDLASQLGELRNSTAGGKETLMSLGMGMADLERNVTKLTSKLDFHNSALKTLADQLALHQNSTLSALQQQTAAVSEALEAHKALQDRVDNLNLASAAAAAATDNRNQSTSAAAAAAAAGVAAGSGAAAAELRSVAAPDNSTAAAAAAAGVAAGSGAAAAELRSVAAPDNSTASGAVISAGLRATASGTSAGVDVAKEPPSNSTTVLFGQSTGTGKDAVAAAQAAAEAGSAGTGAALQQAAVTAGAQSNQTSVVTAAGLDEDDSLVREHVSLKLDEAEEESNSRGGRGAGVAISAASNSNVASVTGSSNTTAASSNTTAAAAQADGSYTTAANAIQYNSTNVWTGWGGPNATMLTSSSSSANTGAAQAASEGRAATAASGQAADATMSNGASIAGSDGGATTAALTAGGMQAAARGMQAAVGGSAATGGGMQAAAGGMQAAAGGSAATGGGMQAAAGGMQAAAGGMQAAAGGMQAAARGSAATGGGLALAGGAEAAGAGATGAELDTVFAAGGAGAAGQTSEVGQVGVGSELARRGVGDAEQQGDQKRFGGARTRFGRMQDAFAMQQGGAGAGFAVAGGGFGMSTRVAAGGAGAGGRRTGSLDDILGAGAHVVKAGTTAAAD